MKLDSRPKPPNQEKSTSFRREMKILILHARGVDTDILSTVRNSLVNAFPGSSCEIARGTFPVPKEAYDPARNQYNSSIILSKILEYVVSSEADRILGMTDADLYVPRMNFVFGEAQYLGKAALISLHRLRPEFYGQPASKELFKERAVKEAIHEVGHTLGLGHCENPYCVMFFSLHIGMTDRKERTFCEKCRNKVEGVIRDLV